jgi:hypothetical protein
MCAYRFPQKRVVCLDIQRRPSFAAFVAAFKKHGQKLAGWDEPLQNLEFVQGSLESAAQHEELSPNRQAGAGGSMVGTACVLALHGCNEVSADGVRLDYKRPYKIQALSPELCSLV